MAGKMRKRVKEFVKEWLLPPAVLAMILRLHNSGTLRHSQAPLSPATQGILGKNRVYKDRHKGERCFIICNGPSVNKQNLLPLKDEIVFSVSNGYHHKHYPIIKPRYHCTPQITYTELFTKEVTIEWFKEMDSKILNAEIFLSISEEPVVRENKLFVEKIVNYVSFSGEFDETQPDIFDITRELPPVQSVPIMCLMIAMYMGFTRIYLLGVEHDEIRTGKYAYFYEPTVLKDRAGDVDSDGNSTAPFSTLVQAYYNLFKSYRIINNIARENGIQIFNATFGGVLDVFERVELASLF
jgi:hypothetical protein